MKKHEGEVVTLEEEKVRQAKVRVFGLFTRLHSELPL